MLDSLRRSSSMCRGRRRRCSRTSLDLPTVVCPLKDRLPLPAPAVEVARLAVLPDLRHMPRDRPPARDLTRVIGGTAAHVVPAVPLEPPAWILRADPSFAPPGREWLRRLHPKQVEAGVAPAGRQLRVREPARWKLAAA